MQINASKVKAACTAFCLVAMAVNFIACGQKGPKVAFERKVLDNGVTVIIQHVEGVQRASTKVLYRTGFVDDSEGTPQMARYAARMMSKSATKSFKSGAAWDLIMRRGGHTGVETMPDFTHLTYIVPFTDVGLVLQIEAEHLQSLSFDEEVATFERQRCYDDARSAVSSAPIVEYAAMAANQCWRYGLQEVAFAGALDTLSAGSLMSYINEQYTPNGLIIAITSGLEPSNTANFIKTHLEKVPIQGRTPLPAIEWANVPQQTEVKWDIPVNGVFVWFAPPESESDRILLSLWGDTFARRLGSDAEVQAVAQLVTTSSFTWAVGDMPFFVYATLNDGVSTEQAVAVLTARIDQVLSDFALEANPAPIVNTARDFANLESMTTEVAVRQAAFLTREQRLSDEEALEFILIRHSLNLGLRELLFGDPASGLLQQALDLTSVGTRELLNNLREAPIRGVTVLRGVGSP